MFAWSLSLLNLKHIAKRQKESFNIIDFTCLINDKPEALKPFDI